MTVEPKTERAIDMLQMAIEYGEACSEYTHLCERGGPQNIINNARTARDRTLEALRGAIMGERVVTAEHDALRAETCIVCHGPVATPEQVAADGVDIPGVCYADCGGEHAETEEYARDWQRRALKAEEAIREVSDGADQTIRQFIEERDAALLSVSVAVQLRQVAERTRDAAQAVATRAEERARKAEQERDAMLEGHERLTPGELMRKGGEWLGVVRGWIQRKARNGESVTLGSLDVLERDFTVEDIEDLAAEVASAAMRPQPTEERLSSALRIQWRAEQKAAAMEAERDDIRRECREAYETSARLLGERDEWRACAEEGARLIKAQHIDSAMAWADAIHIDPSAGTGGHEREPGRMGE